MHIYYNREDEEMWYQRWWAVSPVSWSVYTLSSSHYFQSYHDAAIHNDLWLHHGCHVSNDLKQDEQQDGESTHQRHWIHPLVKVPIYQSTQDVPVPPVAVRTRKSSSVLAYASSFRKRFTNELDSICCFFKEMQYEGKVNFQVESTTRIQIPSCASLRFWRGRQVQ